MGNYYQGFVGLNTFMYETVGYDATGQISNSMGEPINVGPGKNSRPSQNTLEMVIYLGDSSSPSSDGRDLKYYKNYLFSHDLPDTASFFNSLMIKRNGPYGYPSWQQIRVGNNPLTRKQRTSNIFTYVQEPGTSNRITINGQVFNSVNRYGAIKKFSEPVVTDSHKALELIGGVKVYNSRTNRYDIKNVKIKTTFGNETQFFANNDINNYYETIEETDENYEKLKELYLNDGLDDDSSPMEKFNLLTYKQTIWPNTERSYMNKTRARTFYINKFWRTNRSDRTETRVQNGFGAQVPSQSMWPLDVPADWATRSQPSDPAVTPSDTGSCPMYYIGAKVGGRTNTGSYVYTKGFDTGNDLMVADPIIQASASLGASGILVNSYAQVTRGLRRKKNRTYYYFSLQGDQTQESWDNLLSASCYYSRRHTMVPEESVVAPSGIDIAEVTPGGNIDYLHLFEGMAAWDAGTQSGKTPFYDSYDDYAQNIRLKGKGYSIIPEFRISSHVATYETKGVTEELAEIFELSGALSQNTTTSNSSTFYEILNTSQFLKHFDLIKKDHEDFTKPSVLTLRCKAVKKFLPYEGFYPAQRTTQIAQQFSSSHGAHCSQERPKGANYSSSYSVQALYQPLFAPGTLFNTIKSGVACDFPIVHYNDGLGAGEFKADGTASGTGQRLCMVITGSVMQSSASGYFDSIYSQRVPFEALVDPETHLAKTRLLLNEPHDFSLYNFARAAAGLGSGSVNTVWNGGGDELYKKMTNNFLAEVPEFFLENQNFSTITSLESGNPKFGQAQSGSFYAMRIKMYRSMDRADHAIPGINGISVHTPQDLYPSSQIRETLTMYSRPTAFGPPSWGGGSGSYEKDGTTYTFSGSDSFHGFNFPYTPPYYHGEAWCDLLFECKESKKYTLTEILSAVQKNAYYTRFHWPNTNQALRDLLGYSNLPAGAKGPYCSVQWSGSNNPWLSICPAASFVGTSTSDPDWNLNSNLESFPRTLGDGNYGPQHPSVLNYSAMQIDSSVNLFGKAIKKSVQLDTDGTADRVEVFSEGTNEAKSSWVIQPKFETPILNFNKYSDLTQNNCTMPSFASESVPRGMWHQYGEIPTTDQGIYLEVSDIPHEWWTGALNCPKNDATRIKSLADLCGFRNKKQKLGKLGEVKQISEAVVAVPFIEKDATRQFFTIPRADIDETLSGLKREVEPGVFIAGGHPKVGETIVDMVKKMRRYVFPPSMDFVRYNQIQPFAMYIFEFTHNLSKQDLADIWQNLPPSIGTSFEESTASITHELLAHELLGGGSVIKDGKLDENAEGNSIPSNIQWMIFKVKKRAQTKYFDKVVRNTGRFPKPALQLAAEREEDKDKRAQGEDPEITYNWPYDFFSLVELVKLDAEVTFSNIENDDKGNKKIGTIGGKSVGAEKSRNFAADISKARGKR